MRPRISPFVVLGAVVGRSLGMSSTIPEQPRALIRLTQIPAPVPIAFRSRRWRWWRRHIVPQGEAPVVEALHHQDDVGNGVVDGEDDHGGQHALQHGAQDVEDIAQQPHDDELDRQAFRAAAAEVFDDLGREDDDPACYGYGAVGGVSKRVELGGQGATYPQMPEMASTSRFRGSVGGAMVG